MFISISPWRHLTFEYDLDGATCQDKLGALWSAFFSWSKSSLQHKVEFAAFLDVLSRFILLYLSVLFECLINCSWSIVVILSICLRFSVLYRVQVRRLQTIYHVRGYIRFILTSSFSNLIMCVTHCERFSVLYSSVSFTYAVRGHVR